MVIDAHLKNVNCVNNMKNKQIQCRNTTHTNTWPLTFALHMKRGGFKIKTVLIIVYSIGNLSFYNLYFLSHIFWFFYAVYTARYLKNRCIFKDSESKMNYLFQLWNSYNARIPDQGVRECCLTPTQQFFSYIMARGS
jgi:hypothetical protein